MPVVPRMEIPPRMPSRAFRVFRAMASPPGTEIVTSRPSPAARSAAPAARTLSSMLRRGTGLMAALPTSSPRPGRVTIPTPGPPFSTTAPAAAGDAAHVRGEVGAIGGVRVVTGVLDGDRMGQIARPPGRRVMAKVDPLAIGQQALHDLRHPALDQPQGRRGGRRRRVGAGGEAGATGPLPPAVALGDLVPGAMAAGHAR